MTVTLALCRTDTPFFDLERQEIRDLFSPERLDAIKKRTPAEQQRSAAGQWLLRELLREAAPSLPFPPRFSYGWQDKPALADAPQLHFNLSHSGDWAVCALAPVEVGVDIQQERRVSPLLFRKFSKAEQIWLDSLSKEEQFPCFFDLWCLKEAYCKCVGDGLRVPLDETSFSLHPLSIDKKGFQVILPPSPDNAHHLALCLKTEEPVTITLKHFDPERITRYESQ